MPNPIAQQAIVQFAQRSARPRALVTRQVVRPKPLLPCIVGDGLQAIDKSTAHEATRHHRGAAGNRGRYRQVLRHPQQMLDSLMLMAQAPVPGPFVNLRQGLHDHVGKQQCANRRHEQPRQVEQCQPCRRQRVLTCQRLAGIGISGGHRQEPCILANPLQLLYRQAFELTLRQVGEGRLQIRFLIGQPLGQGGDEPCPLMQGNAFHQRRIPSGILEHLDQLEVHHTPGNQVPEGSVGIVRQHQLHTAGIPLVAVGNLNHQCPVHRATQHLQRAAAHSAAV